jgi:hypothetical protein
MGLGLLSFKLEIEVLLAFHYKAVKNHVYLKEAPF